MITEASIKHKLKCGDLIEIEGIICAKGNPNIAKEVYSAHEVSLYLSSEFFDVLRSRTDRLPKNLRDYYIPIISKEDCIRYGL